MLQQTAAGRRQLDTGAITIKQLHLELLLQLMDMLGDGRLADIQLLGGLGKVQSAGHRMEYFKIE